MTRSSRPPSPLAELAKLTKRTVDRVEAECRELDVFLGRDWCGRPAVAETDAEQLVSGEARRARRGRGRVGRTLGRVRGLDAGP